MELSIIMPAYNAEKTISKSIRSIQNQTFTEWELIIVDDSSTDDTILVIREFLDDPRIVLLKNDSNIGAGPSRNRALDVCKGLYIAFCDSDDSWLENKAELQINFMRTNHIKISFTSYMKVGLNYSYIVEALPQVDYYKLLENNWIGCLTVMYEKRYFVRHRFPELRKRQDWGMWISMLRSGVKAYSISEPLAIYNVRSNSLSNSNRFSLVTITWRFYKTHLGFSGSISVLYLLRYLVIQLRLKFKLIG